MQGREYTSVPEEIRENSQENRRLGINERINRLIRKYPKASTLVGALGITYIVAEGPGASYVESAKMAYQEATLHPEHKQALQIIESSLGEDVSREVKAGIFSAEGVDSEKERETGLYEVPRAAVSDFEQLGLSEKVVRTVLYRTFPKGFLNNFENIRFLDQHVKMPPVYGIEGYEAAHASGQDREIVFTGGSKNQGKEGLVNRTLIHEVFHMQDWDANTLLMLEERIDLLAKIITRIKSNDRYKSPYVEAIKNDNKGIETRFKAKEYFAEIGESYLSGDYHLLPEADKQIIKDFIAKFDLEFDRAAALKLRDQLIGYDPGFDKRTPEETQKGKKLLKND